jgi:amino acid transporter/nucleotide-binding universal stress UspA family protein
MKKFETEVRLSREMSLMDATLIGVGAMIGAGIFVLTGIAAGVAGPALILAFLLNGFVALLTAMSYAELGSCFHDAGGGYLWAKEGLPRWNGFISGWMSWFAHAVACSVYAIGFGAYFEHLLRELNISVPHWGFLGPQKILAAGIAMLFAYINFRGASETGKVGNMVTITKIVILLIFVLFGLEWIIRRGAWQAHFTPFMPHGWSGIFKAMGLTFIAFEGYEVIAQSSEEIRNPRDNIPRAVFLSLVIVVPIYLLVAVTALGAVAPGTMTPWDYLALKKETALVDVARNLFAGGGILLLFGGLISTMSALNATTYSSSRVAFAMGRDRNFPAFFSRVHSKNFTPQWAILVSLIIVVIMAVSLPIEDVASAADVMFLLLFLQVNLAMIRLRKKRPELYRGFAVPFYPWLSIFGILTLLFLALYMLNYSPTAWAVTALWIVAGFGVYKGYASKKEVEHIQKVEALERIERKDYRILVCLSNPKSVKDLTHLAVAIAKKHNAEILFLHVIEVREGQALSAGLRDASRARSLLEEAVSFSEKSEVPAYSIVQVSHRISQGIVETAAMEKCNFILIKRKKQPAFLERIFSSLIDTVLQKSPSEVAVLHGELPEKVENILIPFGSSIHTRLAIEIAPAINEYFNAKLHVVVVFDPDIATSQREERIAQMKKTISENVPSATFKVIFERDVLKAILEESKKMDIILMAGRGGDFLELLLARSLSQEITGQVKCPVLWLKEYEERSSFWVDFFKPSKKRGEGDASSIPGPVPPSQ